MHTFISRLIVLFSFIAVSFSMQAQTYEQLWKDMQTAFNSDLPKSALVPLQTIREKALAENNNPQLLRAICTEYTLAHVISPDSDAVMTRRIEEALAAETRPVERALWESALGQLTHSRAHLLASVADVQLQASVKATDYLPLFVVGKDSRWFSDDLLSVLAMTVIEADNYPWGSPAGDDRLTDADRRDVFLKMRAVYEAQHNEEALLMVDYYGYTRSLYTEGLDDGKLISRIRQMAPRMKGNTYAAAVLTAWADSKETPDVHVGWRPQDGAYAPGSPVKAIIRSRNVGHAELRLYRVKGLVNTDLNDEDFDDDADRRRVLKSRRAVLTATYSKDLQRFPAHETFSDTLDFNLPDAGIYIARLIVDGKTRSTSWMHVSRVAPLVFSPVTDGGVKNRLTLVDVVSGRPFTEGVSAKVGKENMYNDRITWTALEPAADGTFELPDEKTYDYLAVGVGDDQYCAFADSNDYFFDRLLHCNSHQVLARTYTDRAIYRPGQTVQFNTLVYSRDVDEYKAVEGWKGKVVLQNTERKDIAALDVVTDAMGQCSGEFRLPDPAIPGSYAVVLRGNDVRNTQYITVEEYKRPTFRVVIAAPDSKSAVGRDRWEKGDTITLEGRVETYSGIGIPDAQVRRTTSRSTWLRYGGSDQSEVADTLTTDADGRFRISIPLDAEGFYSTQVEATASNGETASAHHNVYVGTPVARNTDEDEKLRNWCTVTYSKDHAEAKLHIDATAVEGVSNDDPLYLFVDVVSTKGGLDSSHRFECGDSLDLSLKWRPEFGDAATLYVKYVRRGHYVSERAEIIKPEPDKRLMLEWSTFRNLLQPGEQETWSLTVRRPDGSPADATVMARLYDASLDAFARNPWTFSLNFPRTNPLAYTSFDPTYNTGLFYSAPTPYVGGFILTAWEPTMFDYFALRKDVLCETVTISEARVMGLHATSSGKMRVRGATSYYKDAAAPQANMAMAAEAEESAEAPAEMMDVPVRENFNETAFFLPALRTDADGRVAIAFTLPESLTEWNFTALAHDAAMNYGVLNDTVVARKMLMAEIAAPRFLRQGDTTEIPVTVRNLTDETQTADVLFVITDAATGRTLKTVRRSVKLDAATTPAATASLTFPLEATTDVRIRVVAKTAAFSDGEERLIPVLSGRELVEVSVPFSLTEPGDAVIDLSSLNLARLIKQDAECRPTLSVEYCANPLWSVIRVVPALLDGEAFSATDWATRLYTVEVADFLARGLKGTEASALVDSLLAARDIPALRYSALHHLGDFQQADGGFSWIRGFQSSPWITTDVAILLARQQVLTGSTTASDMLRRATAYLDKEAARMVDEMKRTEKEQHKAGRKDYRAGVSEVVLRYLYVRQLQKLESTDDVEYLLERAALENKSLTMYGKAVVAQILQQSHPAEAALALQSLVEHTVATPEMGRYFDTERALGGWASYKIPTQTMAIEALDSTPSDADVASEMRLWLLQSKRTQKWESSRASADATYALLHGKADAHAEDALFQTLHPEDHSVRTLTDAEASRAVKTAAYTVHKTTDGLSWGAVRAVYTLPVEQVEASSAGFTLTRSWEVLRDGKWVSIQGQKVKVGEHIRQVITLRAERDYDFVQLEASRAACLEPLHPLSGMTWMGGAACYRMVRDNRNDYYFEHLAKGTHTFVEELIVDRTGTFATGTAHVYSTFAPEFRAYAPSTRVFATSK